MFIATSCLACHRLGNDGGGVGPDLNRSANRYTLRDLMENIIEPSKVVSNQYESTIMELRDGTVVTGRIIGEEDGILQVAANPTAPQEIKEIRNADVESRQVSPISMMPLGLINRMNQDEVLDLIAYILSAGDPKHPMFR